MVSFIFEKGGSAEASSTEMILYFAWEAEEIFRKKKRYQEHHHLVDVLSSAKNKDLAKAKPGTSSSKPECSCSHKRTKDTSPRVEQLNTWDHSC
jgi:CDGSH-type Zn-finger protein